MRILLISHYYPPETLGGTQGYVEKLARLLHDNGHVVAVIAGARAHASGGALETTTQHGVLVHRVVRDLEHEFSSGDLGSERISGAVARLAREFAPDVVHVHHWHALSRDLVRRLKALGRPVFLTLHDLFVTCPLFFRMPDARTFCASDVTLAQCAACISPRAGGICVVALEKTLGERREELRAELQAADRVLCVSRPQADLLRSIPGFADVDLHVAPIGIALDDEEEHAAAAPAAEDGGRLRLVNWGGIDPRKGIHLILEAVAASAHRDRFEIHLHGREGEADYMAELHAKGAGLRLFLHGEFAEGEERRFAREYHVAVLPFLAFETYALAVDEALRRGLPVVTSDQGAPPDRLGGRGLTFKSGDAGALKRVLERLLLEPEALAALRRGAHGARDLREHYRELIALYGGAGMDPS